jgi:hypothetical protein
MLREASEPQVQMETTTTTTQTRTELYKGTNDGGEMRKLTEAKGELAVKQFEKDVAVMLQCFVPVRGAERWCCMQGGYLCSDGLHAVYHADIDKALSYPGHSPSVCTVNSLESPDHYTSHARSTPQICNASLCWRLLYDLARRARR